VNNFAQEFCAALSGTALPWVAMGDGPAVLTYCGHGWRLCPFPPNWGARWFSFRVLDVIFEASGLCLCNPREHVLIVGRRQIQVGRPVAPDDSVYAISARLWTAHFSMNVVNDHRN